MEYSDKLGSITSVPGIRVGHAENEPAVTGCTVVLPDSPAQVGVDVRGSAPGTREIEAIRTVRLVPAVHGILLTGGSAFGLDAASGVQQWLEERGIGFETGFAKVPIVPAAVIFDLGVGDPKVRPDRAMGYRACDAASAAENRVGRVGAGIGATVGKMHSQEKAMWGGLGVAAEKVGDCTVGALVIVNALGGVLDPSTGEWLAGPRDADGRILDSIALLKSGATQPFGTNTTLAVIATDAALTREQATKVAQMAQDGIALVIRPAHTMYDGDVAFALSVGSVECDVNVIGAIGAELVAAAIVDAVRAGNQ